MNMKRVFAEIGLGNKSFLSTEFEDGRKEYRINKFVKPKKIKDYYIRIWLFKIIFIFSTNDLFKVKKKDKNKFKIVFGIGGYG